MADRTQFSFDNLKKSWDDALALAESLRRQSPTIIGEIKTLVKHPRSFGSWLEAKSPWLGRRFLGVASSFAEPFTVGMGFRVEKLGEEMIEVVLPGSWRNQGEHGAIHTSALSTLGEIAMRIYWEHFLDLGTSNLEVTRVQCRLLRRAEGEMKAVFRLPVSDREAILHRLRTSSSTTAEAQTIIYDSAGRLVAEVEVDWTLTRQLSLSSSSQEI